MDAFAISETNTNNTQAEVQEPERQDAIDSDNKFQRAITSWRTIDLTTLIAQTDSSAAEILANQKDALLERKDVAQKTKDFRKLDDAGKLSEYKTLLKAYQSFIDLLTTHNKTSSSAFLQLYTPLSEAPDPFPLLEASVESLVAAEETLPKITFENEELKKRVGRLAAQLDEAEQKLQTESKGRKEAEDGSGARIKAIEDSWARVLSEKEENWTSKEKALEEKVENQDRLYQELKANYEVSDRLEQGGDAHATMSKAATAEIELLSSDLEKTSARLAEMEARNEQLRLEIARASSQMSTTSDEEAAVQRLQAENSGLLRRLESARFERDAERREWETRNKQSERQKASVTTENQELKSKLQKCSNYDEIKRELNMLRSIELSADIEDDDESRPSNGHAKEGEKESLEQLLLARNKKLSDDFTLLRMSHQELQQKLEDMKGELFTTRTELTKSQKLAAGLENDLLHVQEEAANLLPSSGMSVAGTYTSRYPTSSRRGRSSPTSSIISGFDGPRLGSTTLETLRSGEPVGGGSGILPMIQAQRDRFKQKNQQLEEELQKTYSSVTALRQEVASLQKDNLNLYEKTRYVSTYNRGGNTSSSSAFSQAPTHTSVFSGQEGDTSDRWKSKYEAEISPFAAFRGRESERAYRRMSAPERMVFSLTRIVLSTRASRNLFAGYCLALHLLVLLMLYWASTSGTSHLGQSASAAMVDTLKDKSSSNWKQADTG